MNNLGVYAIINLDLILSLAVRKIIVRDGEFHLGTEILLGKLSGIFGSRKVKLNAI
jgi:hypothetical protein